MSPAPRTERDARAILAVAMLAGVVHAWNLTHVARAAGCDPLTLACLAASVPWVTPDTSSYLVVAREIADVGPFRSSYLVRGPGYPLLLAGSQAWLGHVAAVLWLEPLLAVLAALGVARIAWLATSSAAAGLAAAGLFAIWPASLQFGTELLTDAPHAFLAVAALAATLDWREHGGRSRAALAAAAWAAAQSLRPTFFFVPLTIPLLLWTRPPGTRNSQRWAIWLGTLLVPAALVIGNFVQHGVATASAIGAETLSCYAIPRLRAELGEGDFFELREAAFERYRAIPLPQRIAVQRADSYPLLRAHPLAAARSVMGEWARQLLAPPRPFSRWDWAALYPSWSVVPRAVNAAFWLAAGAGALLWSRRDPAAVGFVLIAFLGVMLPAATSALVENRLRLPMDLWAIPLVAIAGWHAARASVIVFALRSRQRSRA